MIGMHAQKQQGSTKVENVIAERELKRRLQRACPNSTKGWKWQK